MRVYSQFVFPRLCDLLLDRPLIAKLRRELLAHAGGDILEIGFGTGLNVPCYPAEVSRITTVDPNPGMHALAQRRVRRSRMRVAHHVLKSESLPFGDATFDCVVSTFTLCSIDNPQQALAQIHRVLKLGGRFLFLEHGLSPEPGIQKWQHRLDWLERRLADGCRLNRNMRELIRASGFAAVVVDEFYLEGVPRTHGYLYRGLATK